MDFHPYICQRGQSPLYRCSVRVIIAACLLGAGSVIGQVTPKEVNAILPPEGSLEVQKEICTPEVLPRLQIYFLADCTGSMNPVITSVIDSACDMAAALAPAEFGAGYYRDFPYDADAYLNQVVITDDCGAAAVAAIETWVASGGADGSEAQLYALDQLIEQAGFSSDPTVTPVVVWFGDAPGHDPVCSAISGLGYDITEDSVTTKLVDGGIRVVAISTTTGYINGLDDDPTTSAYDYGGTCTIGGTPGQATRIAAATGGVHLIDVEPEDIVDAIIAGISALPALVEPMLLDECEHLMIEVDPSMQEIISGECAAFTEVITVAADAPQCDAVLHCRVAWTINGQPVELPEGGLDPAYIEDIIITVPDVTPPEVGCLETVNPSGKHIPKAGKEPHSGVNPDGFYELVVTDNCDPNPEIWVVDSITNDTFGPYYNGDKLKLTQSPGRMPRILPMPGVILDHLQLRGEALLVAFDDVGNMSAAVPCYLPPPPK